MHYTHFLMPQIVAGSRFRCISIFFKIKIDQIEGGVSRFEVPGSKWNFVLPVKTCFLPGTSLFLPAGDVCREIKMCQEGLSPRTCPFPTAGCSTFVFCCVSQIV